MLNRGFVILIKYKNASEKQNASFVKVFMNLFKILYKETYSSISTSVMNFAHSVKKSVKKMEDIRISSNIPFPIRYKKELVDVKDNKDATGSSLFKYNFVPLDDFICKKDTDEWDDDNAIMVSLYSHFISVNNLMDDTRIFTSKKIPTFTKMLPLTIKNDSYQEAMSYTFNDNGSQRKLTIKLNQESENFQSLILEEFYKFFIEYNGFKMGGFKALTPQFMPEEVYLIYSSLIIKRFFKGSLSSTMLYDFINNGEYSSITLNMSESFEKIHGNIFNTVSKLFNENEYSMSKEDTKLLIKYCNILLETPNDFNEKTRFSFIQIYTIFTLFTHYLER